VVLYILKCVYYSDIRLGGLKSKTKNTYSKQNPFPGRDLHISYPK